MNSLYYGLSIVAVFVVIHWCIKNDGRSATAGLLSMKPDDGRGSDNQVTDVMKRPNSDAGDSGARQ